MAERLSASYSGQRFPSTAKSSALVAGLATSSFLPASSTASMSIPPSFLPNGLQVKKPRSITGCTSGLMRKASAALTRCSVVRISGIRTA
jgi:hypothetical protein